MSDADALDSASDQVRSGPAPTRHKQVAVPPKIKNPWYGLPPEQHVKPVKKNSGR